jgi:hypothetical protein
LWKENNQSRNPRATKHSKSLGFIETAGKILQEAIKIQRERKQSIELQINMDDINK